MTDSTVNIPNTTDNVIKLQGMHRAMSEPKPEEKN